MYSASIFLYSGPFLLTSDWQIFSLSPTPLDFQESVASTVFDGYTLVRNTNEMNVSNHSS